MFWRLMGGGISWIIGVVLWVAHLPGAVGAIPVFGIGPLLLCTAGLLLLCLLRTPLRLSGVPLILVAAAWALATPQPDLLVSADGESVALRAADGRLAVLHVGRDTFAVEDWLVADGDARDAHDSSLRRGIACDPSCCIGKLADGAIVAYAVEPEAFEDDCARADLILAVHDDPPSDCAAKVIKRETWYDRGALALRRDGAGFVIESARSQNYDRPWAPAWHPRTAEFSGAPTSAAHDAAPRDATPVQDDIDADE